MRDSRMSQRPSTSELTQTEAGADQLMFDAAAASGAHVNWRPCHGQQAMNIMERASTSPWRHSPQTDLTGVVADSLARSP